MNLYLVTCVSAAGSKSTMDIFVVANSPSQAETTAIDLMRKLQYPYTDRVDTIRLLASVNTDRADHLLVLP